jgi:HEAT repeat protein
MSVVWLASVLGVSVTAQGQDGPTIGGKSPGQWAAALRGDDPEARRAALWAISLLGPEAKEAVSALIAVLDDPREDVLEGAIRSLQAIGPDAAPAAPTLALKLGDRRFFYNSGLSGSHLAVDALAAIGPSAVPALIEALGSHSEEARGWAAVTLGRIGPAAQNAVPVLDRLVKKQGALEGTLAVQALGKIGPAAAEAIPTLHAAYDALKPGDDYSTILDTLSMIGAPPSLGLIRQLDDPDPQRRVEAAILVGNFGPKARAAVGPLQAALGDLSRLVRVEAAAALARIDPSNARAWPVLILALNSTDLDVLDPAISAIAKFGPKAAAAVPKLKQIVGRNDLTHQTFVGLQLESTIDNTQAGAAEALVVVSPGSSEGVSALLTLLRQGEDGAEGAAIEALGRLGPKAAAAAPALAAVARDAASIYRYNAIKALARIDPQHEAILPALIGLLSDSRPGSFGLGEEEEVITTLGLMGSKALPAVPWLVRVLADKREERRQFGGPAEKAAKALGRIGPAARDALPALVKAMKTEHGVLMVAAEALELMGTAARPAISDLIALLKSEETRPWAARVLGTIGPEARAAVPALVVALNDRNPFIAADVGSALLRIDPSQRGVVEARLASIQDGNCLYASAVLSGALGRRSPEATGLTRQTVRTLNGELAERDEAIVKGGPEAREYALEVIEERFKRLAELGAGAAEAVPRLTELTHHAEPLIQRLATEALKRIEKK